MIVFDKKPGVTGDYSIVYDDDSEAYGFYYKNLNDFADENNEIYRGGTGTGNLHISSYDSLKGTLSGHFHFMLKPNASHPGLPSYEIKEGQLIALQRADD